MKDTNQKTIHGRKKPRMSLIPGPALVQLAKAFEDGAAKYGAYNWREEAISVSTYVDALERHLRSYFDGEKFDPVSKVHHLAHGMACLAILLDAECIGNLIDDRPIKAPTGQLIRRLTKK